MRGFIAIKGDRIAAVGGEGEEAYRGPSTRVIELGDRTVLPRLYRRPIAFSRATRWVSSAWDLGAFDRADDVFESVRESPPRIPPPPRPFLGHGLSLDLLAGEAGSGLGASFLARPAVLFAKGGETCWMNAAAKTALPFFTRKLLPGSLLEGSSATCSPTAPS